MKLNSFKFQDGKVFWLPEYPEKPTDYPCTNWPVNQCPIRKSGFIYCECKNYERAIENSLVSAIEVAPEDMEGVKHYCFMQSPGVSGILSASHLWQPENGKVYSAECEIETKRYAKSKIIQNEMWFQVPAKSSNHWSKLTHEFRQVAHLKPKAEIFPAANSHDMKEEEDLDK